MTEARADPHGPAARRVLVVEDDDDVRRVICRLLTLYGYHTEESSNGIGAYAHLRLCPPDLLLLDLVLPGDVSGFDVVRRMREHAPWRTVPVVPMIASLDLDDRIQALGPRFVLRKPFSLEDLLDVVSASVTDPRVEPA